MGQSSISPLDDYIKNVDKSNKSLWGGSVYWALQSNTFLHNLTGFDGECCYPNTSDQCGDFCSSSFTENGMLIPHNFFKHSFPEDLHAFSTTHTINNDTKKYGNVLLVALNIKQKFFCDKSVSNDCSKLEKENLTDKEIKEENKVRASYLDSISKGKFDENLNQINIIVKNNKNITFLFRIGYEIQLSYFIEDKTDPKSWEDARDKWKKAYIHIAKYLKKGNNNVKCVLHIGQETLFFNNSDDKNIIKKLNLKYGYQFDKYSEDIQYTTVELMMNEEVDLIGFSIFSGAFSNSSKTECQLKCIDKKTCNYCNSQNKPCIDIQTWFNNNDKSPIQDSSLRANMYVAQNYYKKPLMICESGMQSPWQCNEEYSIKFLQGMINVLKTYKIYYWSFIGGNSWKKTGWKASDGWPQIPFWHFPGVKKFFIDEIINKYLEKK